MQLTLNGGMQGLRGLSGSGAGLSTDDPCYDPNNSWYNTLWTSDAECACMAANPSRYGTWQKCADWSPKGVAKEAGTMAADVVGGVASGVGGGLADSLDISGTLLIAAVALVAFLALKG